MQGKQKDFFEGLFQVAKAVNSSLHPTEVLETIVNSVAKAMGVKASSLRLLSAGGQRLTMGGYCGLSKGYIHKGPILIKESGLDQKALKGEVVYIRDAQKDPGFQYPERAKEEGIHSLLVVPLMVKNRAIGVLRAYTSDIREFDADEIMFLEAAANLSAIALDNARLYEALKRDYELLIRHQDRLDDN